MYALSGDGVFRIPENHAPIPKKLEQPASTDDERTFFELNAISEEIQKCRDIVLANIS